MADDGMDAWRARRMAELQAGAAEGGGGGGGGGGAGGPSQEEKAAQQRAQEEQRRMLIKQVLSPAACERLANIALVKPDKARQLENYFLQAASSGRLGGQVSEQQLKDMLTQFTENEHKPKVTVQRRRMAFDDDDDDEDDW